MKISRQYIYFVMANALILIGIILVQFSNQQLGYEIGSIYAGIIFGVCIAIMVLPSDKPPLDIFEGLFKEFFRVRNWFVRKKFCDMTKEEAILLSAVIGIGGLSALMAIIGNYIYPFFKYDFEGEKAAAIIIITVVGLVYGMILFAHGLWFDYFIWKGKLWHYILALLMTIFVTEAIVGFLGAFFQTTFFAIGLLSRSITSVLIQKWNYIIDKNVRIYVYTAICFLLLIPLIYRL